MTLIDPSGFGFGDALPNVFGDTINRDDVYLNSFATRKLESLYTNSMKMSLSRYHVINCGFIINIRFKNK